MMLSASTQHSGLHSTLQQSRECKYDAFFFSSSRTLLITHVPYHVSCCFFFLLFFLVVVVDILVRIIGECSRQFLDKKTCFVLFYLRNPTSSSVDKMTSHGLSDSSGWVIHIRISTYWCRFVVLRRVIPYHEVVRPDLASRCAGLIRCWGRVHCTFQYPDCLHLLIIQYMGVVVCWLIDETRRFSSLLTIRSFALVSSKAT